MQRRADGGEGGRKACDVRTPLPLHVQCQTCNVEKGCVSVCV